MMRLALHHMKGRTGASVINVASISGWLPQLAMSGQYGAAKAALIFDTERWALEFVPHGNGLLTNCLVFGVQLSGKMPLQHET
jgi:NAD(P)-dependent dehydrogenase (short-subunit alcohol dehydrogenase family)